MIAINGNSERGKALVYLTLILQLGLELALPPVLCIWISTWLRKRYGLGNWIVIVGILVGLLGCFSGFKNFYRMVQRKEKEQSKERHDEK